MPGTTHPPSAATTLFDSPIGALVLTATARGITGVMLPADLTAAPRGPVPAESSPAPSPPPGSACTDSSLTLACRHLAQATEELDAYFAGASQGFSVALDMTGISPFDRDVLAALAEVGHGTTISYAQLAAACAHPTAVRAVASACARNRWPILLGCHRVVRSDGSLGGYRGGPQAKRLLLELESAVPR